MKQGGGFLLLLFQSIWNDRLPNVGRKKGEEDRKGISCDYFLYRSRSRFLYRTDRYRLVRAPQFSGLGSDSFER